MNRVGRWLDGLGLGRYGPLSAEHDLDKEALAELTDGRLKELGISLGHRLELLKAIAALR